MFGLVLAFMSVELHGLDNVRKELNKLEEKFRNVDGEHQVPLIELLNSSFMNKYTNLDTAQDFVDGCENVCGSEFSEIDENDENFTDFIKENTNFNSWSEMLKTASKDWVDSQLKF